MASLGEEVALREASIDYTLTVVVSDAAQRSAVLERLLANILDAVNKFGVPITAPQCRVDPQPTVVPPDRWFAPPSEPRGQRCPDETS